MDEGDNGCDSGLLGVTANKISYIPQTEQHSCYSIQGECHYYALWGFTIQQPVIESIPVPGTCTYFLCICAKQTDVEGWHIL